MGFSDEQLNKVYDRTDGRCHLCGKKLTFKNYGCLDARGAWEVEHSNPKARGGTNRLNNLYPACIACNRSKGAGSTKAARARNGRTRAPMSAAKRESARQENAVAGGLIGGGIALLVDKKLVPLAMTIGAAAGYNQDPEK